MCERTLKLYMCVMFIEENNLREHAADFHAAVGATWF